ncbi:solute carrier family 22 member 8-like [Eriocheir sinensis]|uniref:solute carrier family 22 member 8-like n=1 Tax=Eriocheir sinensis TaxID=95602 RepID=UPI0021CA93E7|nr:solute carrier family 22 member 8-like [Eriocheir sinensis]
MAKLLKPSRLDTDPSSPTAAKEWKHWYKTFTIFIEESGDAAPNKFRALVNCVSPSVYEVIEDCGTFESAITKLESAYVKLPNEVFARFGRRPMAVASTLVLVSTGICTSWLPNVNLIIIARFLLGFCHMSGKGAVYGLVMETVPPRMRAIVGMATGVGWGLTVAVLGGLGYYIREWRRLQLLMSLPFILLFPAVLLMDESPRWLIVHGRRGAAFRVLTKVAAWHRVRLPPAYRINNIMDKILAKVSIEFSDDL